MCFHVLYITQAEPSLSPPPFSSSPTPVKLHYKSLSKQSLSIQGSWHSFPISPHVCLLLNLQHLTTPMLHPKTVWDAESFFIKVRFDLLLCDWLWSRNGCNWKPRVSPAPLSLWPETAVGSVASACVFVEASFVLFTCSFAETTAGTFTSTTALSFTYCMTLGWMHMLYASSAASMSSGPCVPPYHVTALWQVSHTSQAGFSSCRYCSALPSTVHYSADLYFMCCHSSINDLSLHFITY